MSISKNREGRKQDKEWVRILNLVIREVKIIIRKNTEDKANDIWREVFSFMERS